MTTGKMLDTALALADEGYCVFPVATGQKRNSHGEFENNKTPLILDWPNKASKDAVVIGGWWAKWPSANIGIACGISNIVVLDIDGEPGRAWLAEMEAKHGPLPSTARVETPRPGQHYYWRMPRGEPIGSHNGKIAKGIDVKGAGGYVVAPISTYPGGVYRWAAEDEGATLHPEPLPTWLDAAMRGKSTAAKAKDAEPVKPRQPSARASGTTARDPGNGSNGFGAKYVQAAIAAELGAVVSASVGTRNDTANRAAFVLGTLAGAGAVDPAMVEEAVVDAAMAAGLGEREARKAARSGLGDGVKQPRKPPAPRPGTRRWPRAVGDDEGAGDDANGAHVAEPGDGMGSVRHGIELLAESRTVYKRYCKLVSIVSPGNRKPDALGIVRPEDALEIAELGKPNIWERLSIPGKWAKHDARSKSYRACDPPKDVVAAIHGKHEWDGIERLQGIVTAPIMIRTGAVLSAAGYDADSGLFYAPSGEFRAVTDVPSQEEATRAVENMLEVVHDFPFEDKGIGPSAWLAHILTLCARSAIEGNVPMFVYDGNIGRVGKSHLANAASLIGTGAMATLSPYTKEDDEMRKRITAHLLAADRHVLIDNIPDGCVFGWPSMEAALTSGQWADRLLGTNVAPKLANQIVWSATGNNLGVYGTMSSRIIRVRLVSPLERPGERPESDFKHPNLFGWLKAEWRRLHCDALTILRHFVAAGRPKRQMLTLGSFDEWSELIRGAILCLGLADPGLARATADADLEPDRAAHVALLTAWEAAAPAGGMTCAEAIFKSAHTPSLAEAIATICGDRAGDRPTARRLGERIRKIKQKPRVVTLESGKIQSVSFLPHGKQHQAIIWAVGNLMNTQQEGWWGS